MAVPGDHLPILDASLFETLLHTTAGVYSRASVISVADKQCETRIAVAI